MMYIRQVQILVQTQICTWLIVYTKRGAASSFCSTSRVLFSILFLQILFPSLPADILPCCGAYPLPALPPVLWKLFLSPADPPGMLPPPDQKSHRIAAFRIRSWFATWGSTSSLICSGSSPAYNGRMASLSNTALVSTTALSADWQSDVRYWEY